MRLCPMCLFVGGLAFGLVLGAVYFGGGRDRGPRPPPPELPPPPPLEVRERFGCPERN